MTDPYRPFPATPTRAQPFPRERLHRAGLDDDTIARLESEYGSLDAAGRTEFSRFVTAHSDDAIRDRFADGAATDTGRAAAGPTYDELNALTVDELDDRLREWNDAHPEQHLTIAGRKGEKIGRLLDAYEQEQGDTTPAPAEPPATPATGQLPTAPTATTPEGTPAPGPDAPPTGTQQPAQTADAAGAGPTT